MKNLLIYCLLLQAPFLLLAASAEEFCETETGTSRNRITYTNKGEQKELVTQRLIKPPKIDGSLTDEAWTSATTPLADGFIQIEPQPGVPSRQKTEVYVMYDDNALYIVAHLHDTMPDSIMHQLSRRDDLGNTDWFGVVVDAYQDGLNGLGFILTAAGVQTDIKYTAQGEEVAWNAVWQSAALRNEQGWVAEMRIPFSAFRFANADKQTWNINFVRLVRRYREKSAWNEIKPEISGFLNQSGKLSGLDDIQAPVRLFFYPYVSANAEHQYVKDGESGFSKGFNAGMDIKYGINDAFTLDMTLVPDFGQTQSDNQVLNLSPFEVRFNENRQFFTEGTELFGKAGLFYSRRIGGRPSGYYSVQEQLQEGETISSNPAEVQLLNSTKVSGRTPGGLGIGVLNSITAPSHATIKNSENQTRKVLTQPLTNYNIFVLDQNLKNNSYVSFINTNVYRNGTAPEANVSGTEFRLANKTNTYAINGTAALSQQYNNSFTNPGLGYQYNISGGKISGNTQFNVWHGIMSNTYNHNDLGYLTINNLVSSGAQFRYNIYKPFGRFLNLFTSARVEYLRIYKPGAFQNFSVSSEAWTTTRKQLSTGLWTWIEPVTTYDYYEPRVQGRYYTFPKNYNVGGWFSSNYDKRFALDGRANYRIFNDNGRHNLNFGLSPVVRASNKLQFRFDFDSYNFIKDVGFVTFRDGKETDIIFGRRNVHTIENVFSANYIFTNRMGLTFRMRHYFSEAVYQKYYYLQNNGLLAITDYTGLNEEGETLHNASFNAFNIDMVYTWQFAPGSEMSVVWKNAIYRFTRKTGSGYADNLQRTLGNDQTNNLSIKILYFIDYLSLKRKKTA
ncbi:hypothetical protein C7N43_06800 [Sphingobacteriales bacterium UPWRP_1]|nr:hypothetical protein BVG80_13245 [Sphingobacteriales bacterium TSM_CSM]PSJ77791.1 hypothetical protein C7N43_06800 [Sphingobacteriales bacterium UPWRP_1]